jgi:predicted amidohydrolase
VFVHLWSYLSHIDLVHAENEITSRGLFPLQLEPRAKLRNPVPARLIAVIEELAGLKGTPGAFDAFCAEWITGQDHALASADPARFEGTFTVLGRGSYLLRRRADFLARRWGSIHPKKAEQGRSLATYARRHMCVPLKIEGAPELGVFTAHEWAQRSVHARLLAERDRFCAVLWPMTVGPDYEALDLLQPGTNQVHLDTARNDDAVIADVHESVDRACREKATLLLLPELVLTEQVEDALRAAIRAAAGPFPVLTIAGRNHRRRDGEGPFENRAVLLGNSGELLHEHKKNDCFTDYQFARDRVVGEGVECGDVVTVLECDLGNLVPLICLDLFQESALNRVRQSHATVALVPSLSPKTSAHRDAGKDLATSCRALTLVVNRWLLNEGPTHEASSLAVRPDARVVHHIPEDAEAVDLNCLVLRIPE